MYGHGAPPPSRSAGTVITLRVLMTACALLSCGVFACVPLFRAAFLRGRWYDWLAAWASLVVSVGCFVVIGVVPEDDPRSDGAVCVILLVALGACVHYLVADIRFHNRTVPPPGYVPSPVRPAPVAYGYPQSATPYPAAPAPGTEHPPAGTYAPQPPHQAPAHHTPAPHTPTHQTPPPPQGPPPPPPQRPAPARIDQVRAELDELSDYLRRHDGTEGGHEGGR